jgi:cell wall-associated NlpC family hydrolase
MTADMTDHTTTPPPLRAKLDRRRNAYRDDLAADSLRGIVDAPRYVAGETRQVIRSVLGLRAVPKATQGLDTEILFGERVTVFDENDGWAWVQLAADGYVGYTRVEGLSNVITTPTHRIRSIGTFVYPEPSIKAPPLLHLSLNSELTISGTHDRFAELATGGFVTAHHVAELEQNAIDFVEIAERLSGTPYLWGGKTRLGLDCSGLVQIAMNAAGLACPRDSDMQRDEVGAALEFPADIAHLDDGRLQRGDLVFWPGHVGVMIDGIMLLHANAHHMVVAVEPIVEAATRIAKSGDGIVAIKRPERLGAARTLF